MTQQCGHFCVPVSSQFDLNDLWKIGDRGWAAVKFWKFVSSHACWCLDRTSDDFMMKCLVGREKGWG